MRQTVRLALLAALLAGFGAVAVPWAWEHVFPTEGGPGPEVTPDSLDGWAIDSVNEQLAEALAALGVAPEAIVDTHEEQRHADDQAWTFTITTVDLPREVPRGELEIAFAHWPRDVEAFVTRADELTWSVRVYAGKRPIHQLVLRQPLDPHPQVDPAAPPRLAVVLTGVGVRSADVERLIALPLPLTFAVLPYHSHSLRYATDAARAAKEVAVHLVFDEPLPIDAPAGMTVPPPLSAGMGQETFASRFQEDIDAIPYASGAVLSSGSPTPGDYESMAVLVDALQQRELYLLDDEPVDRGVALQVAHRSDLAASSATIAMGTDPRSVLRLRNLAVLRGDAIAAVRVRPGEGEAIEQILTSCMEEGFTLVFASELVAEPPPPR